MVELLTISVMILVSLFLLVKGADYLVDGAADVARWLHVSPVLVGLTIVALGTSLPEIIVSFFSVLSGNADISIGNVVGSNIANIGLVIGISALLTPLAVRSKTLIYEFPFLIIASFLVLILANDHFIFSSSTFTISRLDGVIFILMLLAFLLYIFRSMKESKKSVEEEFRKEYKHDNPPWKNALFILGGITALVIGGKLFITNATDLAEIIGLSEAFIGLTIAALGTSLPELATSGMAAWKKQGDIAIGNIVGSNIFNILFVLGVTSTIKPFSVSPGVIANDGMVMLTITLLFLVFATKGKKVTRWDGAALVLFYLVYLGSLFWRM